MKATDDLLGNGIHVLETVIDKEQAAAIYRKAHQVRKFSPDMFLNQQEYEANPQHWGVNPREGFNFIDQFEPEIACLEQAPKVVAVLQEMLGDDYVIHNKKFVCGIPETWLPDYLKRKMAEASINNLGAYMKPEFRDITYFHGIDFHQDIIDWPAWKPEKKTHEFLTLYVYIHDVTANDAPLFVLPGSHRFGATRFPHAITPVDKTHWRYHNGSEKEMICEHAMLTGEAGYAAVWHSCLVHGTQQIAKAGNCRLSLRYVIQRGTDPQGLRKLNETIDGPLYLDRARVDLDESGKVAVLNNTIRKI